MGGVKVYSQLLAQQYQAVPTGIGQGWHQGAFCLPIAVGQHTDQLALEIEVSVGGRLYCPAETVFIQDCLQQRGGFFQASGQPRVGCQVQACAIDVQCEEVLLVPDQRFEGIGQLPAVAHLLSQFGADDRFTTAVIVKRGEALQGLQLFDDGHRREAIGRHGITMEGQREVQRQGDCFSARLRPQVRHAQRRGVDQPADVDDGIGQCPPTGFIRQAEHLGLAVRGHVEPAVEHPQRIEIKALRFGPGQEGFAVDGLAECPAPTAQHGLLGNRHRLRRGRQLRAGRRIEQVDQLLDQGFIALGVQCLGITQIGVDRVGGCRQHAVAGQGLPRLGEGI